VCPYFFHSFLPLFLSLSPLLTPILPTGAVNMGVAVAMAAEAEKEKAAAP
jgi:hypothetical protein